MPTFKVTAPDGRKLKITGDAMPTEAELDEIFKSTGKPQTQQDNSVNVASARLGLPGSGGFEALKTFGSGAAEMLNPVSAVKGIYGMVTDPMANVIAPMMREKVKADEAARTGQRVDNLNPTGHEIAGAIPIVGPAAAQVVDTMMKDPARGLGQVAGVYAGGKIMEAAPPVLSKVGGMAPPVTREALAMAKDAASVRTKILNPTIGEAGAAGLGALVAGPAGAKVAYGLMKVPSVWKAVREGIAKRKGISGAQAEVAALKMAPEELVAEVAKIPQEKLPAGFTMDAKSAGGPPVTAEQLAAAPSDIESLGFKLKPIPPSKLPVRLPDPEVPELTMKAKAQKAFEEAKAAKSDVVEAPPAFKGQQGAKGATSDRFKANRERIASQMIGEGKTEAQVKAVLKKFNISDDQIEETMRTVSGKGKS